MMSAPQPTTLFLLCLSHTFTGVVKEVLHDPGRGAPLAKVCSMPLTDAACASSSHGCTACLLLQLQQLQQLAGKHTHACPVLTASTCCPALLQVVYRDPVRYRQQKILTIAAEGTYSGQVCSTAVSAELCQFVCRSVHASGCVCGCCTHAA